jgi:hypothetical protein
MMRLENAGLTFPARQPVISHNNYASADAARDASCRYSRYNEYGDVDVESAKAMSSC